VADSDTVALYPCCRMLRYNEAVCQTVQAAVFCANDCKQLPGLVI
jgi:hypothetical protein